jgi:hypothetical protein
MHGSIIFPGELGQFAGLINDVDSHEMIPAQRWVETFGPVVQEVADAWTNGKITDATDKNSNNIPDYPGDIEEITGDIVNVKGCRAPGAMDISRRLDVMDTMGVRRQLMYPTSVGIWGVILLGSVDDPNVFKNIKGDRAAKAKSYIKAYQEWAMVEAGHSDRIRPVPPVVADSVDELMATTKRLIDSGIRAIWLPSSIPPGGVSSAHPDLNPFWEMLAEANCVVSFHIGSEVQFLEPMKIWFDVPAFQGYRSLGELSTDPWFLSTVHWPTQNFLTTMILGGVFVRHPKLRVAVSEVGAYWIGPMMEALDLWHVNLGAFATSKMPEALRVLPSTFMKSNVRVSPFSFEDVAAYVERYPQYDLADVFCFASDYPHVEGGKDMINVLYRNIERLGPDSVKKFFVTNGELLLPD